MKTENESQSGVRTNGGFDLQMQSYIERSRQQYAQVAGHGATYNSTRIQRAENATLLSNAETTIVTPTEHGDNRKYCPDCSNCPIVSDCLWSNQCRCSSCFKLVNNSVEVATIPIGEHRIPVRIHHLWPVFIVLSAVTSLQVSPMYAMFSFILGGPILFGTVLVHELGHASMALRLGGKVNQILLWPLGGLAYISFFGENSPAADALIAIAGPLTHLPQIAFWILIMSWSNSGDWELNWQLTWGKDFWLSLCAAAIAMQIVLFCFNLIPAYPLDGGRLLGALLSYCNVERNRAFLAMAALGGIFGWYLLFTGFSAVTANSVTFFSGWNQMALGAFILYNCYQLWTLAAAGRAASHPGYDDVNPDAAATSLSAFSRNRVAHSSRIVTGRGVLGSHASVSPVYGTGYQSSDEGHETFLVKQGASGNHDNRNAPSARFEGGHGRLGQGNRRNEPSSGSAPFQQFDV